MIGGIISVKKNLWKLFLIVPIRIDLIFKLEFNYPPKAFFFILNLLIEKEGGIIKTCGSSLIIVKWDRVLNYSND